MSVRRMRESVKVSHVVKDGEIVWLIAEFEATLFRWEREEEESSEDGGICTRLRPDEAIVPGVCTWTLVKSMVN